MSAEYASRAATSGSLHGQSKIVAVVEDDQNTAEAMQLWLSQDGFDCRLFDTVAAFQSVAGTLSCALYVLDWSLPDGDGIELLGWLRQRQVDAPILICTSRDSEQDTVEALTSGADDYLVKPVRKSIFLARIHAALRRLDPDHATPLTIESPPYSFDLRARTVSLNGSVVELQPREFEVARLFFQSPDAVLSREHIMRSVWGTDAIDTSRSLDTHVARLRKLLALAPENGVRLRTVYGIGYRLETAALHDEG